jgi:hypothetical protein
VPTRSQAVLAAVHDDQAERDPAAASAKRWTPILIVASPRPLTGKTFLARLLTDFLRLDDATVRAFDLNPSEDAIADHLPDVAIRADIIEIEGQMALFDALILDDGIGKVVDVGPAVFARFFAILEEIGFIAAARRRAIEPVILFPADPHPTCVKAYADLKRRFPRTTIVPVFNEAIVKGQKFRDKYPFESGADLPLQIPLLQPGLKLHAERSGYSFVDFHKRLPMAIPIGQAFELRSWTKRVFLEFREFELRLLLERLRSSLRV